MTIQETRRGPFYGFHANQIEGVEASGSFEVFYLDKAQWPTEAMKHLDTGWYWWPCFPGCLPDGEPSGPFPTAEGAYLDAIGD